MSGLKLRVHRQQVGDGLIHQRRDLRLLCIGGVDLDVQVFQHMIDMGGDIGSAMRAAHHSVMHAAHAGGRDGNNAARQSRSGDKSDERHPAEDRARRRCGISWFCGSSHGNPL